MSAGEPLPGVTTDAIADLCAADPDACAMVLDAVYLYLDGEQETRDHEQVRAHLDECAACLRQYGLEQAVKSLVARCCGSDPVPQQLRSRVMLRLSEVRVELDHVQYRTR